MSGFGVREVERTLGLSRSVIQSLVRAGFVSPTRGPRNAYRFSFRDLVVLKAARELSLAQVPPRRIAQALKRLRHSLPDHVPLSGLRIYADGDRVAVSEGNRRWRADSGQYLLDVDVRQHADGVALVPHRPAERQATADLHFEEACRLEGKDSAMARNAYRRALAIEPAHASAAANLGRLLHLDGELDEAERVYRAGIACCGPDALLLFNLAVLLQDRDRFVEACVVYEAAIDAQPNLADGHYNLAMLLESMGDRQKALRHIKHYRKLVR
jgi:tetratricopeptide (TPR) repeat protein